VAQLMVQVFMNVMVCHWVSGSWYFKGT